jgi:molecular chaperone DnaJ
MQRMGPFTTMVTQPCHLCQGCGKISSNNSSCSCCKGKGDFTEEKIIELKIPMGVEMGHNIVFNGLGEQPQLENDIPGDLIFEVFVQPDPSFERSGLDLIYKSSLTFQESILGKKISIPHYDETFDIDIGEYGIIQTNKSYIIQNKGMKTTHKKGNLILKFNITYPSTVLSQDLKNKLEPLLMTIH